MDFSQFFLISMGCLTQTFFCMIILKYHNYSTHTIPLKIVGFVGAFSWLAAILVWVFI